MLRSGGKMRAAGLLLWALLLAALPLAATAADLAALLPNGKQTFVDANGLPLAGGSVFFYIPATTTPKVTWSDPGEVVPNANPVVLDSAGRAIIYGSGDYRQVVKDVFGNTVWDALTQFNIPIGLSVWGGTSSGTGNAQIVTAAGWTGATGTTLSWVANATNSGATTVTVNGGAPITVVKDSITGPVALIGAEIQNGNIVNALYDGSQLHLLGYPANTGGNLALTGNFSAAGTATVGGAASITGQTTISGNLTAFGTLVYTYPTTLPQGRLTLQTGTPVQTADQSAVTNVFYTPAYGNLVPVYNGSTGFQLVTFAEQTLSVANAAYASNAVYDVFEFLNAGVATIASGPAWTTAGNFVRTTVLTTGTATRSAALARQQGLLTNSGSISARNGASTFTIPANQGTYLGSIWVDAAGQATTCQVTAGQNRSCGVWNMYNRVPMMLLEVDTTTGWTHTNNGVFQAANSTLANSITLLSGFAEELVDVNYQIEAQGVLNSLITKIGIGVASQTVACGVQGYGNGQNAGTSGLVTLVAHCEQLPFIGMQTFIPIDFSSGGTSTFSVSTGLMEMRAQIRG